MHVGSLQVKVVRKKKTVISEYMEICVSRELPKKLRNWGGGRGSVGGAECAFD